MTPEPRNLIRGLDARERAVLVAIYEHKVLLTEHLKAMFFGSLRRAQDRLRHLAQRGLIDTWYPPQPRGMGKASGHHTLTESGAQVVASLLGIARSELRYVVRDEEDREQDSYLAHRIGVNEFFCALIEAGRANDGHGLAKWVRERTVKTADGWIRPDGFGVYLHPGGALDFYLEYDRGTETTRQLANKLAGYIGVARDWTEQGAEHFPCVLIVVPNHRRERVVAAAFANALARFKRADKLAGLPFFVANEETLSQWGVLGRVWGRVPKLDRRLAIIELPAKEGLDYDLYGWGEECESRFGTHPVQICHEWNMVSHANGYEGRPEVRPFTRDELQAFFDHADGRVVEARRLGRKGWTAAFRDAVMFKVIYAWGLRRREAAKLDVTDFGPNAAAPEFHNFGILSVRWGKGVSGGTPRRRNVLTVFDWSVEVLDEFLAEVWPLYQVGAALWPTERGGRVSVDLIGYRFIELREELGLPDELHPHCLRHSYITHLIEDGFDPFFVQQQVGHRWSSTTALYTGVSSDFKNRMLGRALDRAFVDTEEGAKQ